jgi:hypothetical protein
MRLSFKNSKQSIYICKPWPAGASRRNSNPHDIIMISSGDVSNLTRIEINEVPYTFGYDSDKAAYAFYRENGWLLEFRRLDGRLESWVAYFNGNALALRIRDCDLVVDRDIHGITVKIWFCVARLRIKTQHLTISRWIWFPWLRTWFLDGDSSTAECLPVCHLLAELSGQAGREFWLHSWRRGVMCISSGIDIPEPVTWYVACE